MSRCPNCGCPYTSGSAYVTADMPRAWQDADGTWYKGPARRDSTEICDGCGRAVSRHWEHGKLIREDVTNPGTPPSAPLETTGEAEK